MNAERDPLFAGAFELGDEAVRADSIGADDILDENVDAFVIGGIFEREPRSRHYEEPQPVKREI